MLHFSDESKRLVSTFLAYRNDIDIYTEDEPKDKEFYRIVFTKLLSNTLQINDITPLGSKRNVIERCKNEPDNGRKKIFIIDGDITMIHGANVPNLKNLFVLDGYCIENLLLDKESIVQYIYLNCALKSKDEIENELAFEQWLNTYSNSLIDLFIHFALTDFFGGKFTLFNAHKFHAITNGLATYSNDLVEQEIANIKKHILTMESEVDYLKKYSELKLKWSINISNFLTIVSGKDYLIPILLYKVQSFKRSKALPTVEEAKFMLAHNCNLTRLGPLKTALTQLA